MTLESPREYISPPRARLVDVLVEEQRSVVLRKMGTLGLRVESWDEFVGSTADQGVNELANPDSDVLFDCISYGSETLRSAISTEKTWFNDVHEISILGSVAIQLLESGEVESYMEMQDKVRVKMGYGSSFRDAVDSRAKFLSVRLLNGHHENGLARIYMSPDIPPVAIHKSDMDYLDARDNQLPYTLQGSYEAIERVECEFGRDAVDYLSDETCTRLIDAIRSTEKRFVNE